MPNPRPPANKTVEDPLLKYKTRRKQKSHWFLKYCTIIAIVILIILLLLFIIIFVLLPLVFKYSTDVQRNLIFPINDLYPNDPQYSNFKRYNIEGVRNFYISINTTENVTLGVWHILPNSVSSNGTEFNFSSLLADSEYPVVLYFHGNDGNRIAYIELYGILRQFFHVIAFDYRSYGDSTRGFLSEDTLVNDAIQLYKWLLLNTNADIYFWGHSLGTAINTHAIAKMKLENLTPVGLILESPFTTLRDEIDYVVSQLWFTNIFRWLPWYEVTILSPFEENGLSFDTMQHICMVDCPIMILHAEDDNSVPVKFSKQLHTVALQDRDLNVKGNVTLHIFPDELMLDHMGIYGAPQLISYISDFIDICQDYRDKS